MPCALSNMRWAMSRRTRDTGIASNSPAGCTAAGVAWRLLGADGRLHIAALDARTRPRGTHVLPGRCRRPGQRAVPPASLAPRAPPGSLQPGHSPPHARRARRCARCGQSPGSASSQRPTPRDTAGTGADGRQRITAVRLLCHRGSRRRPAYGGPGSTCRLAGCRGGRRRRKRQLLALLHQVAQHGAHGNDCAGGARRAVSARYPLSKVSTSWVALSLSTVKSRSPGTTRSPSALSQAPKTPSSMVQPRRGIRIV